MPLSSAVSSDVGRSIGLTGPESLNAWIDAIDQGFNTETLTALQVRMNLSASAMAAWLGTSARTLNRRESSGRLTAEESDRLFRLASLFERAVDVFGDEASARQWLQSEQLALGGQKPIQIARYEPEAREVERLLGRVERGIPV